MSSFIATDLLIHSLCLATGLTGNSFILIVHFLDWLRTRDHNPSNLILNGIGISNIFLQGAVVFQEVAYLLFLDFYMQERVMVTLLIVITSLSLSSLWCSTCLCFYYCVKIVQLRGTLFYKLKANLPVMVPWLLAFSVVLSWCVGIQSYWDIYLDTSFTTMNITGNITTLMFPQFKSKCSCTLQIYNVVASVAFTLIFLTTGAIIASLCQHMKRMRQNNEGYGHAKVNTHLSAARTMTSLLIVYLLFYTAFSLLNDPSGFPGDITITACLIVTTLFPTINSVILIFGNRNLTNAVKKLLCMQSSLGTTEVTVTTC
ncbi:taste receptor type 2 member 9-like [Rhinoderma darwinii]|uniref:taste receptor type 2 member 9-like n=1 Tax=Rhinoderma darwinii TaxID=43563 RepID=UPI003F6744A7